MNCLRIDICEPYKTINCTMSSWDLSDYCERRNQVLDQHLVWELYQRIKLF